MKDTYEMFFFPFSFNIMFLRTMDQESEEPCVQFLTFLPKKDQI